MADKKTAAALVLLVLVVVTGLGWCLAWSRSQGATNPGAAENWMVYFPELENWTAYFHGYEAYLDRKIHASVVEGSSMEPTFRDGDVVIWVEVDNAMELKVGDIIIYKHPTRPYLDNIVHRIIEVGVDYRENQFKTKGDNSPEEYWVPRANIHGLVIGVIYRHSSP
ncbi:MAG: hypothetical protein APZ16_00450 [Candidatus Hadarchaeum yellowstonense]|uniref:Signal peptidase I n=1 Tax=Hadarchaeum yellowstonense TaxID=1776334 RepID=A0A147JZ59_HADYE|nr:MAG: hypothetical protein APZ16_00450 [Candidatus Hadarchaeum yellowstonense]